MKMLLCYGAPYGGLNREYYQDPKNKKAAHRAPLFEITA
jgi:hypothetical protein